MKRILLILFLIPVFTEAQTGRPVTTTSNYGVLLSDSSSRPVDNKALIIVDGVISNSFEQQSSASSVSLGNNPNTVDPDKIESVIVLSGVSAMALYGSRGTNGAVIITTKSRK